LYDRLYDTPGFEGGKMSINTDYYHKEFDAIKQSKEITRAQACYTHYIETGNYIVASWWRDILIDLQVEEVNNYGKQKGMKR
jgi:hypothetical protein